MKKQHVFIFLIFFVTPSFAATDPKIVEFLEKLNLHYYCLQREGLKNYRCNLKLIFSDEFKRMILEKYHGRSYIEEDIRFSLSGNSNGDLKLTRLTPTSSDLSYLDEFTRTNILEVQKTIRRFINTWVAEAVKPIYYEDGKKRDFKILKEPDGFTIETTESDQIAKDKYDSQVKLMSILVFRDGVQKVAVSPRFSQTSRGYLFTGATVESPTNKDSIEFKNGLINDFWMPQTMILEGHSKGGLAFSFELDFLDYEINK